MDHKRIKTFISLNFVTVVQHTRVESARWQKSCISVDLFLCLWDISVENGHPLKQVPVDNDICIVFVGQESNELVPSSLVGANIILLIWLINPRAVSLPYFLRYFQVLCCLCSSGFIESLNPLCLVPFKLMKLLLISILTKCDISNWLVAILPEPI